MILGLGASAWRGTECMSSVPNASPSAALALAKWLIVRGRCADVAGGSGTELPIPFHPSNRLQGGLFARGI